MLNSRLNFESYTWQDVSGNKITILIEDRKRLFPVEVNLGKTVSPLFFKELDFWNDLTKADPSHSFTVYEGARSQKWSMGYVIAWNQMVEIKQTIDRMA